MIMTMIVMSLVGTRLNEINSNPQIKSNSGFCEEGKTGGKPLGAEKRTNKLNPQCSHHCVTHASQRLITLWEVTQH